MNSLERFAEIRDQVKALGLELIKLKQTLPGEAALPASQCGGRLIDAATELTDGLVSAGFEKGRGMTPGRYLRLRREAAGLSIRDCALIFGRHLLGRHRWHSYVIAIEADRMVADEDSLARLRTAFAFDLYIYRQLVAGLPIPQLCRACACSWMDPCEDETHGPCAWAQPDLCTRCAKGTDSSGDSPPPPPPEPRFHGVDRPPIPPARPIAPAPDASERTRA